MSLKKDNVELQSVTQRNSLGLVVKKGVSLPGEDGGGL